MRGHCECCRRTRPLTDPDGTVLDAFGLCGECRPVLRSLLDDHGEHAAARGLMLAVRDELLRRLPVTRGVSP